MFADLLRQNIFDDPLVTSRKRKLSGSNLPKTSKKIKKSPEIKAPESLPDTSKAEYINGKKTKKLIENEENTSAALSVADKKQKENIISEPKELQTQNLDIDMKSPSKDRPKLTLKQRQLIMLTEKKKILKKQKIAKLADSEDKSKEASKGDILNKDKLLHKEHLPGEEQETSKVKESRSEKTDDIEVRDLILIFVTNYKCQFKFCYDLIVREPNPFSMTDPHKN